MCLLCLGVVGMDPKRSIKGLQTARWAELIYRAERTKSPGDVCNLKKGENENAGGSPPR